ncbi:uncharacterized protein [Aegilops tauschii subsp. strangulata]|uniref:uncharacterized protein isoform X1 n=1 Tax=Aegilops tauschii subsp. strangulata TaxID=200361 RepID=UPI001ABC2E53|nr:uncharacterized protein LOC109775947 isoform X3 [Aegilops tauschii subsp. strangulata]XP_044374261.1 uncharacterized protein LOC123096559 isoform X2 [Triticum aestivum]
MYSAPRASLLPMVSRSSVSSSRAPPPPWATAPRGCGCPAHVAAQDAPHGLLEARFCHICNKEEPTLPAAKLQAINFPVLLIDDFSTPEKNQSFSNEIDETKNQEYKWREEAFRKGFPCLPTT